MNNFDWVLARDNCSTSAAFEELCTNIEKDVDARNKLSKKTVIAFQRTRDSHTEIRTEDDKKGVDASNTLSKEPAYVCQRTGDSLTVSREADSASVTFRLIGQQIVVSGYRIQSPITDVAKRVFIACHDKNGDCCLAEVGGVNDGFWRGGIRESTLDALFFDSRSDRPRFP